MSEAGGAASRPFVTVVVEGYNESQEQGTALQTMAALERQDYPLDRVTVVLVGSSAQIAEWEAAYSRGTPFRSVRCLAADGCAYYELKNKGARLTDDEIIAFTDSDVCPRPAWLGSIVAGIEGGADVVVGVSLFRGDGMSAASGGLLQAASAITYGWILGAGDGRPEPCGFLAHNVGFRADTLRAHPYRNDLGRTCASVLLHQALRDAGARMVLQPDQQAAHYFTWRWWLFTLYFRFGHEVCQVRRAARRPHWLARTGVLEPVLTMASHMATDVSSWFRYSAVLRVRRPRRWLMLPAVLALSVLARGAEMLGMYATLLAPRAMKRWAETS